MDSKTPYSGDIKTPANFIFRPEQWLAVVWAIILAFTIVGGLIKG